MKVVGHDEEGGPIWELTSQEYEQHKQELIAARAAAKTKAQGDKSTPPESPQPPSTEGASSHSKHAAATQSPQEMELGSQIWEMRKRGLSRYEIHRRLGIPREAVDEILQAFQQHFYPDIGQAMSSRLALDDQRLDDLFRTWLPIATSGPLTVIKTDKKGREYTEMDVETPVRAANIVLGAIQRRIQLAVACRPESAGGGNGPREVNVVAWLSQVMPNVQQVVNQVNCHAPNERPRQTLVLECEAERDLAPEGSVSNSNGSNR
jgi:hypothetical protein